MRTKVKGKYNKAIIYTNVIEDTAKEQIKDLCDMKIFKDSKIRIMPDVHAGAGCTIGTTMTIKDAIVPNLVGVDIGCGMETVMIEEKEIDFEKLDNLIKEKIPYGRNVRKTLHRFADYAPLEELKCKFMYREDIYKELYAIGSLGGGNHFIEVDKDEDGNLYLVIHSGSRHLGKYVAEYYQKAACMQMNSDYHKDLSEIIQNLKLTNKEKEIQPTIEKYYKEHPRVVKDALAYCTGELFNNYIHDMNIVQYYADLNRKAMANEIIQGMGWHVKDVFTTIHNYIDINSMILRKGAVSAKKGEKLLIPINMRDGSLICIGKGNKRWNESAPHGAGRLFSRNEAFKRFDVEEFKKEMEGIYTTTATEKTLDESPMAYKSMGDIVNNIKPTAKIIKVIKPIYNFKAED